MKIRNKQFDGEDIGVLYPVGIENRIAKTGNAINIIFPWKEGGTWIFDDPERGLVGEPFVLGIPDMIDKMVELLDLADKKVKFIFSKEEFPEYHASIKKVKNQNRGAWYKVDKSNIGVVDLPNGWLCPATLLYFKRMPKRIFIRI